jgi:CO/xanthine dehydrogenase FAD-binding subunit
MSLRANNYYKAKSVEDAYNKLQENPKNAIIAGGFWMKKTGLSYETLIDLSDAGLDKIEEKGGYIHVGAMVSLRDFENSPLIQSLNSGATAFGVREVLGPAFRNSATIGGSVFGRYPFSDVIASLLPLDVQLVFYPKQEMSLEEYLNFRGKVDGVLQEIIIKKEEGKGYFKKVKATALDFPMINFSIVKRNNKNYIAIGSRPLVAALAKKAMELADQGKYQEAADMAAEELQYMDSNNISKEYRKDLVRVYVCRGLEEVNK